jgi:hypothetical protein
MPMNRFERLLVEMLIATLATATVVICFRYLDIPAGRRPGDLLAVGIPVAIAAAVLLAGPLRLLRRGWRRRSMWARREPSGTLIAARVAGVAFGAWVGAVLQAGIT